MGTKFGVTPIVIPGGLFLDPKSLRRTLSNIAQERAQAIKTDFNVTAQTWNNKPTFKINKSGSNGRIFYRTIGTDSDIYKFIDKGTKIRYAVMTPNFQAKTRVRVIGSRAGKGGFSRFNFKKPKPGIKARNFSEEIAAKWTKLLPALVERALLAEIPTK